MLLAGTSAPEAPTSPRTESQRDALKRAAFGVVLGDARRASSSAGSLSAGITGLDLREPGLVRVGTEPAVKIDDLGL